MYRFENAIVALYRKLHLWHEIVQHYIEKKDNTNILKACQDYYEYDPTLWLQALTYFASQQKCEREIQQVLQSLFSFCNKTCLF